MRLTCPRCGAQYEIAAAAIPAAGREVECSACGNVWFQTGQPKAATPYDPQARPALNRQLNESVLAILRDETARELQARQADAGRRASARGRNGDQDGDQNIANVAPDVAEPAPAADAIAAPAGVAPGDAPAIADAGWPAATLTSAPARPASPDPDTPPPGMPAPDTPGLASVEAAAETAVEPVPMMDGDTMDTFAFAPFDAPAAAPDAPALDEDARPDPVIATLPDAAELAATLTRPGPPPAIPPAFPPYAATPSATRDAPEAAASASLPVVAAAQRGSGYASGFGLAAMLALGLVAVYALAPRVAADEDGGLLAEWRQDIDRGRLWLHDRIIGE